MKKWICENVAKRVTEIEGMTDDIGNNFLGNKVNGVALLVMGQEDIKEIGVTQVGSLAILFEEIKNLCLEKKFEAVFVDQNA